MISFLELLLILFKRDATDCRVGVEEEGRKQKRIDPFDDLPAKALRTGKEAPLRANPEQMRGFGHRGEGLTKRSRFHKFI